MTDHWPAYYINKEEDFLAHIHFQQSIQTWRFSLPCLFLRLSVSSIVLSITRTIHFKRQKYIIHVLLRWNFVSFDGYITHVVYKSQTHIIAKQVHTKKTLIFANRQLNTLYSLNSSWVKNFPLNIRHLSSIFLDFQHMLSVRCAEVRKTV